MFYLRLGLFCLRLVFVAYGKLVSSSLLAVEVGLVFFAYGGNRFGLLYGFPRPENRFGLLAYGSPPKVQKDET